MAPTNTAKSASLTKAARTTTSSSSSSPPTKSSSSSPTKAASSSSSFASSLSKSSGVLDFLQRSVSAVELRRLYVDESRGRFVCRAVVQALSPAAQQMVLRLACTGGSFPLAGVQLWTRVTANTTTAIKKPGKQEEMTTAAAVTMTLLQELYKWAILSELPDSSSGGDATVSLTPDFYKALQESLCKLDASPWVAIPPSQLQALEREAATAAAEEKGSSSTTSSRSILMTPEDLERYTQAQWDAVLHFLVGTVGKQEPPPAVVHFLLETGLMQPDPEYTGDEEDAPLVITQAGYEFMLQDHHQQVWHFVVQYLKSLETHPKSTELRKEALLLLICLSFARVGEAYHLSSSFNKDGRLMVKHLTLFGLLYTRKVGKQTIFYPTRVAMQLVAPDEESSGGGGGGSGSHHWSLSTKALEAALAHPTPHDSSHLAIIVQTNFQLCAYTTSELHVSMLGLFCDVGTIRRLPNIVYMSITRDSVKAAFQLGIQARQILRFLEKHAHPKLRVLNTNAVAGRQDGAVPSNVVDQIWLWDRERKRVKFCQVYQHECLLAGEFQAVQTYAMDKGYHQWSSEQRQQLLLDYRAVERVQNFARRWRAKAVARQQRGAED